VSDPGTPPAYRTGFLHDNVYTLFAPTETGAYGEAWPSTVYARIHELSGWAGRGHRSFLPKRPYVEPAMADQADHLRQIVIARLAQALGG
jgi:phage gpG-like protein